MNDFLERLRSRAGDRRRGRYLGGRIGKSLCFVQGDQNIANQAGAAFRSDLNAELQALVTSSQGASAPGTTYRNQFWHDTTANVIKRRNAANAAWIVVDTLDETFVLSRSSNTVLGLSDYRKTIVATSSFTQTLTAAATLGDGWWCNYRNDGTGAITLDPNSSETIDGDTTLVLPPGDSCLIVCNGAAFKTIGRRGGVLPEVASPGGANVDFTIPSWARRATIAFASASWSASDTVQVQLGDAGGVETTGYISGLETGTTRTQLTSGFALAVVAGANAISGIVTLVLQSAAAGRWSQAGNLTLDTGGGDVYVSGGNKNVSAPPATTLRITTVGGTATLDGGAISVMFE